MRSPGSLTPSRVSGCASVPSDNRRLDGIPDDVSISYTGGPGRPPYCAGHYHVICPGFKSLSFWILFDIEGQESHPFPLSFELMLCGTKTRTRRISIIPLRVSKAAMCFLEIGQDLDNSLSHRTVTRANLQNRKLWVLVRQQVQVSCKSPSRSMACNLIGNQHEISHNVHGTQYIPSRGNNL